MPFYASGKEGRVTRLCYDSTSAADLPADAVMIAGYIDGRFKWSDDDWPRFPNAVRVRIAVFAETDDGDVLDVEWGCAAPGDVPGWVVKRRDAGADPSVYVNGSNWQVAKDACAAAGIAEPHWWVADYGDGINPRPAPPIPDGAVACQYEHEAQTGGHYDLSVVADYWPGVDQGGDMTPEEVKRLALEALAEFGLDAPTFKFIKDRLAIDAHHTHDVPLSGVTTAGPK